MKNKTLFFKNLFISFDGKENNTWFHQATFYLASSFNRNRIGFLLCNSKFSSDPKKAFDDMSALDEILKKHPEINMVCITLLEGCFFQTKKLVEHIRKRSDAFIAVGGIMPTLTPEHVLAHLPEADLIFRGEGEEILPKVFNMFKGLNKKKKIPKDTLKKIRDLKGVIFRVKDQIIRPNDMSPNYVANLDDSYLDFSLLGREEVKDGLNLSTSRGCRNACFFCTTPKIGGFRAKSFRDLQDILVRYEKRLIEIYGGKQFIPERAYKLSFNDDDFLADRDRAIKFFSFIKDTRFKINFFQAAVNSFFLYKNNRSTSVLDHKLINSLSPRIFSQPIGKGESQYSIYIGTENFCDEELKRLGKGYNFNKIESVVSALSKRKIRQAHHLILTNSKTGPEDLSENFKKIAVLKRKFGEYFDILRPVITHLVSLFPSFSYKMLVKNNERSSLKIASVLRSKKDPGLDYFLVEKDLPQDEDVRFIAEQANNYLSSERYYDQFLENFFFYLNKRYKELSSRRGSARRDTIKKLLEASSNFKTGKVRNLADLGDFLIGKQQKLPPLETKDKKTADIYGRVEKAFNQSGLLAHKKMKALDIFLLNLVYEREKMIMGGFKGSEIGYFTGLVENFKDYPDKLAQNNHLDLPDLSQGINRLVLLVTHSCQLRCRYCSVRKFSSEMSEETLRAAIDLLFTSKKEEVQLQFFGGEPLLKFNLVKKGVAYALKKSKQTGKKVKFILTTNGIALDQKKADYLIKNNFTIECSLDGDKETQMRSRRSENGQSFHELVMNNFSYLAKKKADYYIISVVQPENVDKLWKNINYLYGQGFKHLQVNYALGFFWGRREARKLLKQMQKIKNIFDQKGKDEYLVNAIEDRREPVILNAEITVDSNGEIFLETGISLEENFNQFKKNFKLGDLQGITDINTIFNSRSRNMYFLVDAYSGKKKSFRELILNNIDMGLMLNRVLRAGRAQKKEK